jgi:ADP-ribosylglycohydrolase
MLIALASSVCAAAGYSRSGAVAGYLRWANSKCPFAGRNTRALFVGVKTLAGFEGRWARAYVGPSEKDWSQSNGALMRCAPLAALPADQSRKAARADCALSNPHPVCVDAELAFLAALRALIGGAPREAAIAAAAAETKNEAVECAVRAGAALEVRDIRGSDKGWVLHALYAAFYGLNRPGGFQERIDAVIRLGGDTDTNAAIAGALIGADEGAERMAGETRTKSDLTAVLGCATSKGEIPRPPEFAAARLPELAGRLSLLGRGPAESSAAGAERADKKAPPGTRDRSVGP